MFFDKIFGAKEKQVLSYIGTDVHSHLIPGIDDGAKDYETSLACIAEMQRQGINKIYITPHFQKYRFNNDEDDVVERFEKLKQLCLDKGLNVEFENVVTYMDIATRCDNLRGPQGRGISYIALSGEDTINNISNYTT